MTRIMASINCIYSTPIFYPYLIVNVELIKSYKSIN
jgi:hypothetical protein